MHEKIRILFISADPFEKGRIRLAEEVRSIYESIRMGSFRDLFEIMQFHLRKPADLQRALLRHRPHIVHFSAHNIARHEIILADDSGLRTSLNEEAIVSLFDVVRDTVHVVFLDGVLSESQTGAISAVIDYTIANKPVMDYRMSLAFAAGFYQALAFGESVASAFDLARTELNFAGLPGKDFPSLLIREGVDPNQPFLAMLESADEREDNEITSALNHVATATANDDERRLIRRALSDGNVVLEMTETNEFTKAVGDNRGSEPDILRSGTKEDIRAIVNPAAYERIQEELYPTPRGLPPPPPGLTFIGREKSLSEVKKLLEIDQSELRTNHVTVISGWPGVGKTSLVSFLARDPEVTRTFPDGVLWTSLEQSPEIFSKLAQWGQTLGTIDLSRTPRMGEVIEKLGFMLRDKQMLLIIDGVWDVNDAVPFVQAAAGSKCSLLATTRIPIVAERLAKLDTSRNVADSIYVLPVLAEDDALSVLRSVAPDVVKHNIEVCREIVRDLECLPLALHVAGALLRAEEKMGLTASDLLEAIRRLAKLMPETASIDRAQGNSIPTVEVLLRRSVDSLDRETRECFAYLGVFAPKPASFDTQAMAAVWAVDDPNPIVRKLVNRGLLEPVGDDRFQLHSLLVEHAQSLLS